MTGRSTGLAVRSLALDDVVDLEHLGLASKLDPQVLQQRHQALAERIEVLARVPDLADSEVPVRPEGDVVLESLRQPVAGFLETADGFVVLGGNHIAGGRKAGEDLRLAGVHDRCRGRSGGGHWMASFVWMLSDRADLQPNTSSASPGGRGF